MTDPTPDRWSDLEARIVDLGLERATVGGAVLRDLIREARRGAALTEERLAAALHEEWDRRTNELSEPGLPCPDCLESAERILAALESSDA